VEEVSSGANPIAGVSTSTAGFVGGAERGPLAPQFITSWLEFQQWYGSYLPDQSFLAYAVEGFFMNGGQRCFISRVVPEADAEYAQSKIGSALNIAAIGPGQWGTKVKWAVDTAFLAEAYPENNGDWVKIIIEYQPENGGPENIIREVFDNLTHEPGVSNNLVQVVNRASLLVRLWWDDPAAPVKLEKSAEETVPGQSKPGRKRTSLTATAVNQQAQLKADDFKGAIESNKLAGANHNDDLFGRGHGLAALSLIDEISILVVPDAVHPNVANNAAIRDEIVKQAEELKDRFAIFSAEQGSSDITNLRPPHDSAYAGFYFPWIKINDPSINATRLVPPSGHIAGIFARTDIERGVHKAPANEAVRGTTDLEFPVTTAMQDVLNPRNVNCIRDFRSNGQGIRLWGARTSSSDPEWKYVNVRRLFMFVEESVDEGTQWVVFEPNDDATWAKVRRAITDFLTGLWRSGALIGSTQNEAFFVRCDRTTMTQDDIDNGRLIAVIGIAPLRPAEFIILRISQKTAEAPG
jgi:phage tail sheath protein FI